jgi:hypothetical protein
MDVIPGQSTFFGESMLPRQYEEPGERAPASDAFDCWVAPVLA